MKNLIFFTLLFILSGMQMLSSQDINELNKQANIERMNGNYQKAIELSTSTLEKKLNVISFYIRAFSLSKISKFAEALKDCESAISYPAGGMLETFEKGDIYFLKGYCLQMLGKCEEAVGAYETAENIIRRENAVALYSNLGLCYLKLQKYEHADFFYDKAIERSEKNSEKESYWAVRGDCMFNLEKWYLADSFYTRATQFGLQDYPVYWNMATCRLKNGKVIDMFGDSTEIEFHNWGIINCYKTATLIIQKDIKANKASDKQVRDISLIYFDQASFCFSVGKYDLASAALDHSLKYGKLSKTTALYDKIDKLKEDIKEAK
ncbi:MAG: tetratricopeptide repeat protein, partial [Bacteroidota bacterium]